MLLRERHVGEHVVFRFVHQLAQTREALTQAIGAARDLAFRDAGHAHRPDEVVDRPCRDALHVRFLDDGDQRLLARAPRLQERGEVAALPELRDRNRDRAARVSQGRSRQPLRWLARVADRSL